MAAAPAANSGRRPALEPQKTQTEAILAEERLFSSPAPNVFIIIGRYYYR
jgi:hypothetical protein